MRLTYKQDNDYLPHYEDEMSAFNKLGQLEDVEDELGVDLVEFLTECKCVLKNANHVIGYTSKGIRVETDFGYVEEFIDGMKKALTKEELENDF